MLDEVMAQIDSNVVAFPVRHRGFRDPLPLHQAHQMSDDIKGLKIRGVSDWANIETRLGASVVTMDGGDCYEALARHDRRGGVFQPSANWAAGFQEIAPYLTVPKC